MKVACFIPIKSYSERVKGKNFKILNGKRLYEYIISNCIEANVFDDIFIDTNSDEITEYAKKRGISIIERDPKLAGNDANGNDLLNYHYKLYPEYDYYFQAFATSPYLKPESIKSCVDILVNSNQYDSCFTALEHKSYFWFNNNPVNYRPDILPRSQDILPVFEETTGLYGIKKKSLEKYQCRIGSKPYYYFVEKFEAIDINTIEDLILAEYIGKEYWSYN